MKNVDTILFDLDGTLIDTNEIIIDSFKNTFENFLPEIKIDLKTILTFIGPPLKDTFLHYVDSEKEAEQLMSEYRKYYHQNEFNSIKIYPDVLRVLTKLKKDCYNLAVVTTKAKEAVLPMYNHFGFDKIFTVLITNDDVINKKPDKEPVIKALTSFEKHRGSMMVGDNKSDILAGQNAGIYTAGVAWSIKGRKFLAEVKPDFMLEKMEDLFGVLKELNK